VGFRKTSIAIDTQTMSPGQVRTAATSGRPTNPSVGEVYEDMVWDGRAWVSLAVWEARQAASGG